MAEEQVELKNTEPASFSALDMSVNGTLILQYNYTRVTQTGVLLGLANCLGYALLKFEEGKVAKLVTFARKLAVCSQLSDQDVGVAETERYAIRGFFFTHFNPRVMQWSVVVICLCSYILAVLL